MTRIKKLKKPLKIGKKIYRYELFWGGGLTGGSTIHQTKKEAKSFSDNWDAEDRARQKFKGLK